MGMVGLVHVPKRLLSPRGNYGKRETARPMGSRGIKWHRHVTASIYLSRTIQSHIRHGCPRAKDQGQDNDANPSAGDAAGQHRDGAAGPAAAVARGPGRLPRAAHAARGGRVHVDGAGGP
ncbi:hypothetical protein FOXYSP1_12935 [Fusarium oxysporum f. sp. phaseoli]